MNTYSYTSTKAVSTFALTQWVYTSHLKTKTSVLPDGCRDLVIKQIDAKLEAWFLSDLTKFPYTVETPAGSKIEGLRLRPGVFIDSVQLSSWLSGKCPGMLFGTDQLDEFCVESENVKDALDCLASGESSSCVLLKS